MIFKSCSGTLIGLDPIYTLGRQESVTYLGRDPHFICIPFSTEQQLWLSQFSDDWAIALAQYAGEIKQHYPANKLLQFAQLHQFIFPKVVQQCPLKKGTTVFTDGSSNGIASLVIENESYYCQTSYSSAQEVELFAVLQALQRVPQSFNLYSDNHYVVRALSVIETVPLIGGAKASIQTLFLKIQNLI